jgi:hypothetical protein
MKKRLVQVIANHFTHWGKWPDTNDTDYTDVLAQRVISSASLPDGTSIEIETRYYPQYLPYIKVGAKAPIPTYPAVDNKPGILGALGGPLAQAGYDILKEQCQGADLLVWGQYRQLFTELAPRLPELVPIRVVLHSDDCPYNIEHRIAPAARYLTHLVHWMHIFDFSIGETTPQVYAKHGLRADKCLLAGPGPSPGGIDGFQKICPTFEARVESILHDRTLYPVVFVGNAHAPGPWREEFCKWANRDAPNDWQLYGYGMRSGQIGGPAWPGIGRHVVGELYAKCLLGLNIQCSGLYNQRFLDYPLNGIPTLVYDPWGEMRRVGLDPWVHYIPFERDGSLPLLVQKLVNDRPYLAYVVRNARAAYDGVASTLDGSKAIGRIYNEAASRLW